MRISPQRMARAYRNQPPSCNGWLKYEGLLVISIVVGLMLLALLEQVIIPYFRH
jgi:hypothetical protein